MVRKYYTLMTQIGAVVWFILAQAAALPVVVIVGVSVRLFDAVRDNFSVRGTALRLSWASLALLIIIAWGS